MSDAPFQKTPAATLVGAMEPTHKLDPKRAELAGAITRTIINQALTEVRRVKEHMAKQEGEKGK
jgi:hypothetical protein